MCRHDLQSLAVEVNGRQIVTLLAGLVALRMVGLSLLLSLELILCELLAIGTLRGRGGRYWETYGISTIADM